VFGRHHPARRSWQAGCALEWWIRCALDPPRNSLPNARISDLPQRALRRVKDSQLPPRSRNDVATGTVTMRSSHSQNLPNEWIFPTRCKRPFFDRRSFSTFSLHRRRASMRPGSACSANPRGSFFRLPDVGTNRPPLLTLTTSARIATCPETASAARDDLPSVEGSP